MSTWPSLVLRPVDIREKSFEEVPMKFWGRPRNWMGSREMWYQKGNELFNDILYLIISQEKTDKSSPTNTKTRATWTYYSLIFCRQCSKKYRFGKICYTIFCHNVMFLVCFGGFEVRMFAITYYLWTYDLPIYNISSTTASIVDLF